MYKLVIQDDEGKTTVVPLIRDEITIGRKDGNTIRLTERNVSRRHARILRNNGAITIEDLDSYNGIKVNGSRIDGKVQVAESDRVEIGDYLLEFRREGQDTVDTVNDEAETRPIPAASPIPSDAPTEVDAVADTPIPEAATVPVERVEEESEPAARVVALSTEFAGQDWNLEKPRLVIGRTDDNDIWINHRSISRHHAELRESDGRWSIVDLQSSNGVRVNGEDYGKVELRRGDLVDLGHVRLRFVESGEDFVFGRDAQAVDISDTGEGRSAMGIFFVLFLAICGVAAYWYLGRTPPTMASHGGSVADAAVAVARSVADAQPAVATFDAAPPSADERISQLVEKANMALAAESWVEAETFAKEALAISADHDAALAIAEKAALEKPNFLFFDEFRRLAGGENPKTLDAIALFRKISDESVYKDRARADFDRLESHYISQVKATGAELADKRRCTALRRLAVNAGKVFPSAEAAVRAIRCTRASGGGSRPPANTGTGDGGGAETASIEALLTKARSAAMRNQWGAARNACEAILKREPGNVSARSLCLLAACSLKSVKMAERHYRRLPASRKAWAVQQCFNSGVEIRE